MVKSILGVTFLLALVLAVPAGCGFGGPWSQPVVPPLPQPQPQPQPEPQPAKWHPGHYIYTHGLGTATKGGDGMVFFDESHQQRRQGWWNRFRDDEAIAGAAFVTYWGQLEPQDDQWDHALNEIEQDLDFLADMQKSYIFWFHNQKHGGGGDLDCPVADSTTFQGENEVRPTRFYVYPEFLWDKYSGEYICDRTYGPAHGLVLTNDNVRSELKAFWKAMADKLDPHPALEAVIINLETATGGGGSGLHPGFTQAKHREAFKDLVLAVKSYFKRTNVIFNISYKLGTREDYDDVVAWAHEHGIGLGNTDLPALCVNQPWGSGPQDPACPDGIEDPAITRHPIKAFDAIARAPKGIVPGVFRIAGDQLGQGHWVGQRSGYLPQVFVDFCNQFMGCTHLFWVETFASKNRHGDPEKQAWKTGVLPFLRTDPNAALTHTDYPTSKSR